MLAGLVPLKVIATTLLLEVLMVTAPLEVCRLGDTTNAVGTAGWGCGSVVQLLAAARRLWYRLAMYYWLRWYNRWLPNKVPMVMCL